MLLSTDIETTLAEMLEESARRVWRPREEIGFGQWCAENIMLRESE